MAVPHVTRGERERGQCARATNLGASSPPISHLILRHQLHHNTMDASSINPPSPAASPRFSPSPSIAGHNLKIDNATQLVFEGAFSRFPQPLLDRLDKTYNRYTIPLMSRLDFEKYIMSIMEDPKLRIESEGMLEDTLEEYLGLKRIKLGAKLHSVKINTFMEVDISDEVDVLLPLIQQQTLFGWSRYIIETLLKLSDVFPPRPREVSQLPTPRHPRKSCQAVSPSLSSSPRVQRTSAVSAPATSTATRIQKTRKKNCIEPLRRSSRLQSMARMGMS